MSNTRRSRRSGCIWWILLFVVFVVLVIKLVGIDDKPADKKVDMTDFYSETNPNHEGLYDQLNDFEKGFYNDLYETVKSGKLTFEKSGVNYSEYRDAFSKAVNALFYDHPEFFWINGGAKMNCKGVALDTNSDTVVVTLGCYDYWNYVIKPEKYIDELNQKVQELANEAKKYSTDYERVKFVHDYLVTNVEYDHFAADEINNSVRAASSEHAYSAYGCLVKNKAVCSGYAKAFQLVMKTLGIKCDYITGDAGGPHGWNCVYIDGQGYYMDVTWDDADDKDANGNLCYPEGVEYKYFCVTTQELSRNHTVDNGFTPPTCVAVENNYFVKEDYLVEKYNFNTVDEIFERQKNLQIKSVKFASYYEYLKAYNDLFGDKKRWCDLKVAQEWESIRYGYDKNMYVLCIKTEE